MLQMVVHPWINDQCTNRGLPVGMVPPPPVFAVTTHCHFREGSMVYHALREVDRTAPVLMVLGPS